MIKAIILDIDGTLTTLNLKKRLLLKPRKLY